MPTVAPANSQSLPCPLDSLLIVEFQFNTENKKLETQINFIDGLVNGKQLYRIDEVSELPNSRNLQLKDLKDCAPLDVSYNSKNDTIEVKLGGEFKTPVLIGCDITKACTILDKAGKVVSSLKPGQSIDLANVFPKKLDEIGFYSWVIFPYFFLGVAHFILPFAVKPSGNSNNEAVSKNGATSGAKVESSISLSVATLKEALREVLDEKNSDLVLVKRDCPYIPIRSLNGRDGSIYGDGETIYLDKLGKTFKVLGSFHIVRDSDLNLATCYALGLDKEPSLILPEVILKQLQGAG